MPALIWFVHVETGYKMRMMTGTVAAEELRWLDRRAEQRKHCVVVPSPGKGMIKGLDG